MSEIEFRRRAIKTLTNSVGVYALCDLDQIPVYVGQSSDGIQSRVRRHLTSARSDIIANRQIDVWEIAYVWAFPAEKQNLNHLEAFLYHHFNDQSRLMNGSVPKRPNVQLGQAPEPSQIVQVIPDAIIQSRIDPGQRAARQANHYCAIADHFLNVKPSDEIGRAMEAHLWRLVENHKTLMSRLPLFEEYYDD